MPTTPRFTSKDLASLPHDGRRYEIIDGELYVSKQPKLQHQLCSGRLHNFLANWIDGDGNGCVVLAPGLIFSDDNDVVPDLVWLSAKRLEMVLGPDGHFHGAPEIAVEVLSPGPTNAFRDREIKRKLYSRRGVEEYWILDWAARTVEVYRRRGEMLKLTQTLADSEQLTSPLLKGFTCSVSDLFNFKSSVKE
jgi:Uma2 family endonuclease